jgi:hypothetical protein
MGRLLTTAGLACLVCVGMLIAAVPAGAVNCGGGVTVKGGTACWKAKSIVKEYKKRRKTHVQGFDCAGRSSGGRIVEVNCKLQSKRIHWEA